MLKDLVFKCRTYRRFYEDVAISMKDLRDLVDLARLTASTANSQALKFRLCNTPEDNAKVFDTLGWAGALPDWDGPGEGERPSAYIIILCDLSLGKNKLYDDGVAAQTMMLGAVEKGYGGCILGNVQRTRLAEALHIDPSRYSIDLVLALGKPKEEVVIVPVKEDGDIRYYRDENQVHYVPKRELDAIIV
ncbi:nitroreductase family protein [Clostridium sp. Marseille-P2415]|uniref:nitroreductase family protein n=1 Tax=Clostridium sp. Marseille-P2415 TaxID=1805471 RepID=UPI00098863AB|nr:nitroreductase family protein [Clostridium sp. Marseille-P2415]